VPGVGGHQSLTSGGRLNFGGVRIANFGRDHRLVGFGGFLIGGCDIICV